MHRTGTRGKRLLPVWGLAGLLVVAALLGGCGNSEDVSTLAEKEGLLKGPPPSYPILFGETFADNSQGWTLGPEWQIGPAAGFVTSESNEEPGVDHTPTGDNGIAGVVIGGQYDDRFAHGFYYLTSPPIDTSGVGVLKLQFFRWLNSDYLGYITNVVEVFDGGTWLVIWSGEPGPPFIADGAWTEFNYDVSLFANPNFRVRFGFDMAPGAITDGGWNLDDVTLSGL